MSLPIRTTVEDIEVVCGYLATKPTGATLAEAKAVVDGRYLDSRKLTALKFWRLIEEIDHKIKLTDNGRATIRESGAYRSEALKRVVQTVAPYSAAVERSLYRQEKSLTATDLAAHWYEHFREEVSDSDKILNDQAICFFQIAQGADLGALIIGRKGMSTRFEFDPDAVQLFVEELSSVEVPESLSSGSLHDPDKAVVTEPIGGTEKEETLKGAENPVVRGNRVFITHGKDPKITDQIKQIVTFGKFEPVIAEENETSAKPVPQKVMDDMRSCDAAVIHVSAERILLDQVSNQVQFINENVLIEIGAAMALYGDRFVLLVEKGVTLPSNLQGLYECRYEGTELNMEATMKLLKAFNDFGEQ